MKQPTLAVLFLTALCLGACDNPADSTYSAEAEDAKQEKQADTPENAKTLELDGENTTVQWTGSKPTGSKHDGGFKTLSGTATVADEKLIGMEATIDIKSMWSDNEKLTKHLLNEDFFESETYGESRFVSTEIREATADEKTGPAADATHWVTGNLTLKGVTKSITFPVTIEADEKAYRLDAEFDINRGQFGMDYGLADAAIRDEVVIRLNIDLPRS
ncbi:MAG: YceI family protein [Phycisphaeraceae bacterium]